MVRLSKGEVPARGKKRKTPDGQGIRNEKTGGGGIEPLTGSGQRQGTWKGETLKGISARELA